MHSTVYRAKRRASLLLHTSYDVDDRRIGKQVDDNGDGTFDRTERYVHDGQQLALQFDGSGNRTHRYFYGSAIDQVLADEDASGNVDWLLADNQGTIRDIAEYSEATDTTAVVNHVKYDSYGNIVSQTDAAKASLFAYTGREWDADADLYYYRARWYDPSTGRFLSEDPLSFAAGDVNLQRYVGNSPVNGTDPLGLFIDNDPSRSGNESEEPEEEEEEEEGWFDWAGRALDRVNKFGGQVNAYIWNGGTWIDPESTDGMTEVGGDTLKGLGTGGKALVNPGARALSGGLYSGDLLEVTEDDEFRGYDTASKISEAAWDVNPIDPLSKISKAKKLGKFGSKIGRGLNALDDANIDDAAKRLGKLPSTPPARGVDIAPRRGARPGLPMSMEDAIREARRGGDVMAAGRDAARRIAEAAGDGPPVWDPPHGPGQKPHYHPTIGGDRAPGHVLY